MSEARISAEERDVDYELARHLALLVHPRPVGEDMARLAQVFVHHLTKARQSAERDTANRIWEAAAKLVEDHGHSNGRIRGSHKHLAKMLRARSSTVEPSAHNGEVAGSNPVERTKLHSNIKEPHP